MLGIAIIPEKTSCRKNQSHPEIHQTHNCYRPDAQQGAIEQKKGLPY
jgi:hypothetical protein